LHVICGRGHLRAIRRAFALVFCLLVGRH
jgi:hypothetical protein